MPNTLSKIINNRNFQQIQELLQQNQIYQKLTEQQINQIKSNFNDVNLSANAHILGT